MLRASRSIGWAPGHALGSSRGCLMAGSKLSRGHDELLSALSDTRRLVQIVWQYDRWATAGGLPSPRDCGLEGPVNRCFLESGVVIASLGCVRRVTSIYTSFSCLVAVKPSDESAGPRTGRTHSAKLHYMAYGVRNSKFLPLRQRRLAV